MRRVLLQRPRSRTRTGKCDDRVGALLPKLLDEAGDAARLAVVAAVVQRDDAVVAHERGEEIEIESHTLVVVVAVDVQVVDLDALGDEDLLVRGLRQAEDDLDVRKAGAKPGIRGGPGRRAPDLPLLGGTASPRRPGSSGSARARGRAAPGASCAGRSRRPSRGRHRPPHGEYASA